MSYDKTTIKIDSLTPGWKLDAWQIMPKEGRKPFPTVVMAHGFCGLKEHGLEAFAKVFVEAGCACILFDYRHHGGSDGTPRNVLIPWKQIEDYRTVLAWARRQRALFDPRRLGVWGFSYSGGHALQVAAEEGDGIAFAMSECPLVDGIAAALVTPPLNAIKLTFYAAASSLRQLVGGEPIYLPAYGKYGAWAFLNHKEAYAGYESVGGDPANKEVNRVGSEVAFYSFFYRPTAVAARIKCPFLCCIGADDSMVPVGAAQAAIRKVPKGEVFIFSGGHFASFKGGQAHDAVVKAQAEFILRNI